MMIMFDLHLFTGACACREQWKFVGLVLSGTNSRKRWNQRRIFNRNGQCAPI